MRGDHRVPAEGPLDARIAIVGESPGKNEWTKRRPFVGYSGDLLNETLRSCGLHRRDVYITNVIKDHLPPAGRGRGKNKKKSKDEKSEFFFKNNRPTEVYFNGIMEVREELAEIKPNIVVPMGNYALWALRGHAEISKWRGSILESSILPGQKLVPTLHPAFFINSQLWHQYPLFEWDWQRITRESAFPDIRLPQYNFIIDPTPEEIEDAIVRFMACDLLTVDTEWYGPNKLAYIGFADSESDAVVIPYRSHAALRAYRAILGTDVRKIMQNAAFDIVALARQGIEVKGVVEDTMTGWNCCWASLRMKGLEDQASILTDQPYYKDSVDFVGTDDEQGQIYCGTDCCVTHKSWRHISTEEFPITNGDVGYGITQSVVPYFLEASKRGVLCDDEKRRELKQIYLEKANEIEYALSTAIGYTINCRSSQQITKLVHDWLIPAYGLERAKRNSEQSNLMHIAATCSDPAAQMILESIIRVRQNRNVVSRYLVDKIVDADGRMRTNWNPAGTRSGRFSSTKPWWPGLAFQTVPDEARSIFIADPGYIFIGFDYEQAEARVVAMLTYNHELLDDMKNGIDIHTKLASQLPFGLTYEQLLAEIEKYGKDGCRQRFIAKKSRHAFNYVEGAITFMFHLNREWLDTRIGIVAREAEDIRKRYLSLNPGLVPWWEGVKHQIKEKKYIDNCFGRRRMHTGPITDDSIREMVSYNPQSTIADYTTQSIVKFQRRFPEAQVWLHGHDSAIWQVREEVHEEAFDIMMDSVQWPFRVGKEELLVPAEGKTGYSWGDMKRRKAA
ncbi:MAG: DNA polymerase [Pyrinomonadaceae bacterium]